MPPSYNIGDLPLNTYDPEPSSTKERHDLFETLSIASSRSSARSPITFRGKRILLLGLSICLSIIILSVGLFLDIFVTHEYIHQGLEIITTAPLGSTLAIAHALAVLLLWTVPLVIGLHSYRLAWSWLEASVDNGHNRPTPFQ
jgi:hypothetical protein